MTTRLSTYSAAVGKGKSSRVCNAHVVLNPWMFFAGLSIPASVVRLTVGGEQRICLEE